MPSGKNDTSKHEMQSFEIKIEQRQSGIFYIMTGNISSISELYEEGIFQDMQDRRQALVLESARCTMPDAWVN